MAQLCGVLHRNPRLAQAADDKGWLPLHCFARFAKGKGAHKCVQTLLGAYPAAVKKKTPEGQYALNHAIANMTNSPEAVDCIRTLYNKYPYAAKVQDSLGRLPLHQVLQHARGKELPELVALLLSGYRKSVQKPDKSGFLPLHVAVQVPDADHNMAASIQLLLEAFPAAVARPAPLGWLPLHSAVQLVNGAICSVNCIRLLLEAHAGAAKEKTPCGWLPFHSLVYRQRGIGTAKCAALLLDAHPEAAAERDPEGRLPLHAAVQDLAFGTAELVSLLLKAYPEGAAETCPNGWLVLHTACKFANAGVEGTAVVRLLMDAHPEAVKEPSPDGRLPLHIVLGSKTGHVRWECVELLLRAHPDAGMTPIAGYTSLFHLMVHKGCESPEALACVKLLLSRRRALARSPDECNRLPLEQLIENQQTTPELIKLIAAAHPEALFTKDASGHALIARVIMLNVLSSAATERLQQLAKGEEKREVHDKRQCCSPATADVTPVMPANDALPCSSHHLRPF